MGLWIVWLGVGDAGGMDTGLFIVVEVVVERWTGDDVRVERRWLKIVKMLERLY